MDCLRALLNLTSKSLGSCGLSMKGKSSFNIFGSVPQSIWILDSRVTDHMTPFPSYFTSYLKVSKEQLITVANGDHVPIIGSGNVQLQSSLSLRNNNNKEDFPSSQWATSKTWETSQIWIYYKHLGHPSFGLLKKIFPHLFTKESVESFKCDVCQFSKHHHAKFSLSNNKSLEPFDLIHSDVWGQLVTIYQGLSGLYNLLMIVPRFVKYVDFFCLIKNQFSKSIKRLWSDNGTEFVNIEFSKFLKDIGVVHELACVNTPQHNGVAKSC
ncbi:hypothetical protein CR513_61997, partial [Mucuna pruriens]